MNPDALLTELPIVAILRGVTPSRILGVAEAIFGAGIRAIEVPLNSPDAFTSIESLAKEFGDRCLTGAGTVLTVAHVDKVAAAGGKLQTAAVGEARRHALAHHRGEAVAAQAFLQHPHGIGGLVDRHEDHLSGRHPAGGQTGPIQAPMVGKRGPGAAPQDRPADLQPR